MTTPAAQPGGGSAWRHWARTLARQALVVYHAARDPRTPSPVRLLALLVAAYAFSPVDLLPDFIPVLGLLDDLLLVPLGVALVLRWTPPDVVLAAREKAMASLEQPVGRGMGVAIVAAWIVLSVACGAWAWQAWHD